MSDEDNTWLREQAAAIVDAELKRVQDLIEKLASSFIGGSAQQYAKYVSAAESEAAPMKARIENGITIQILEHQGPNPKPSHVPVKWNPTSVGTTHAVLIGIETYQKQDINPVQYALADAAALKEVLVQHFGVTPGNISLWLDSAATRSAFENDLPYLIRGLSPGDRFIFFYAGHGFYANGTNRLTTWDTHPNNLFGTTVSLEEVLLKPLKEHQGVDSLVFIDATRRSCEHRSDHRQEEEKGFNSSGDSRHNCCRECSTRESDYYQQQNTCRLWRCDCKR